MGMNTNNISSNCPWPWQNKQWQTLIARYQAGSLPHALLMAGMRDLGKLSFAKAFAKWVLCRSESKELSWCNQCTSCLFDENQHPDLITVFPEEEGGSIKVDDIRQLCETLSKTSLQNHYKIALIAPAEAMNHAAMNALLKTLEEPTPQTLILLVSSQPSLLPATIRSRCQKVVFLPPTSEEIATWVQKSDKIVNNSQLELLEQAENSPLCVERWLEGNYLTQRQKFWEELKILTTKTELSSVIEFANKWSKENASTMLDWWCLWVYQQIKQNPHQALDNLFLLWDELLMTRKQIYKKIHFNVQLWLEKLGCILLANNLRKFS